LILLLFSLLTLYQSITLPLGEADDETDHYQYLRFVARTGHPPFTAGERREAGFKGGLAPLYYWLTAWPIALVGVDTPPDLRRVNARPERLIPQDGLGINHVLHTLDERWPWRGQVLAWHLVRLLSLPLGWVTISATYALARRLWPQSKMVALGAATFVAFLPRFVGSSAVINDDNLVFALTALLLLVQVNMLQNPASRSPRLFATLGALFGLALLTKYFALILIPEIVFTLVVTARNRHSLSAISYQLSAIRYPLSAIRYQLSAISYQLSAISYQLSAISYQLSAISSLLSFFLALALTGGPWFGFIILRFNRIAELGLIPGLAASLGEPQITEGLVGLLSGHSVRPVAATYSLAEWLGLLYRSFWFEFGWMRLFAPTWVYALFTVFLLLALAGHLLRLRFNLQPSKFQPPSPISLLLSLHCALFFIVVLARYLLSATIDTGQGRHLYPALPVLALFIAGGLSHLQASILNLQATNQKSRFLSAIGCLLSAIGYLLPAAYCLLSPALTRGHYPALPITTTPAADLPIQYRQHVEFAPGLSWAGFNLPSTTAQVGEALPVTLYWRAEREAQQDFLISLCLQDNQDRPVACWRGYFAGGRYPARAWEVGDTLRDRVFIPIPTCYHLSDQSYRLHLELWPLQPDSPEPRLAGAPVLQQTLAEPRLALRPADSVRTNLPQTVELWQGNRRLTNRTSVTLGESLTWLEYAPGLASPPPALIYQANRSSLVWSPLFETPLYLPCDEEPSPFARLASFIAGPTLPPGPYRPAQPGAPPELALALKLRQRALAPITSTLTFSATLAPLSLKISDQPALNLADWPLEDVASISNPPTVLPGQTLPVTIRWQARRWMADPLVISLKLLDRDFQVGGERIATLGDRYPNLLWVPTEVIEETYPLRLKADAPAGLYRLELSLLRPDQARPDGFEYLPLNTGETTPGHNLYPATVRLLDPAHGTTPPHPFSAQLGQAIHLNGYDLSPSSPITNYQSPLSLTLYWSSTAPIATDYTVFTQLIGPDGQVWAQWDNQPQAGRYPTTAWTTPDTVIDRYRLTWREGAPAGQYRLLVGMYDPTTGQRLSATRHGQPQPDNALEITQLTLQQ
jgi:hypothetical protein